MLKLEQQVVLASLSRSFRAVLRREKIGVSDLILSKIDIDSECDNKSSTHRAIVIYNYLDDYCIVLHLYAKKDKTNISNKEENGLKKLFDAMHKSLKGE